MYKFLPFMTNDYSVGLYNEDVNDIYHSAFGALSEAFEKFVNPVLPYIKQKNQLNVLDICYGIGYNTKALLSALLQSNININIDCVDNDITLMQLSPFICSNINIFKRLFKSAILRKNILNYPEGNKIINIKYERHNKFHIDHKVNIILLKNLIENFEIDFLSAEAKNILLENEISPFFDQSIHQYYKFLAKNRVYLHQNKNKLPFVHNIYYKYISKHNKVYNNNRLMDRFNIKFSAKDVRAFILDSTNTYDIVFLDGFTPYKCPCIWSVDFLKEIYRHLNDGGILVTYNTSTVVHNTLLNAGFYVGNTPDKNNKFIGTIASKNKDVIFYSLSERQKGLLNTKAGIPYRDKDLNLDNGTILLNRQREYDDSNLLSATKYLKGYENEI